MVFRKKKIKRTRSGATTVEFAIVAKVLFAFVLAIVEIWNLNLFHNLASKAAYEGTRAGLLPGATVAGIQAASRKTLNSVGAKDVEVIVNPVLITNATDLITVTVNVPFASNGWLLARFFKDADISASASLNRERVSL